MMVMQTLTILGRETELCQAELTSLYPAAQHYGPVSVIESPDELSIDRLGGTIKCARVISILKADVSQVELVAAISGFMTGAAPDAKLHFGISVYGHGSSRKGRSDVQRLGLEVKKTLRNQGLSVRFVEGKGGNELTAAQLKYNQLVTKGFEIVLAYTANGVVLARTYAYQDIDSYSKRDWERPVRDSKVGMLPPKLAQMMINLAKPAEGSTVYDPFCGNGVIMQEALLMGYDASGSDVSPEMVDATTQNLAWLRQNYDITGSSHAWEADATKLTELPPKSVIVSEGYLGTPIHANLRGNQLSEIVNPVNSLYHDFLKQTRTLLSAGDHMVISMPCWPSENSTLHLPVLDQIGILGYATKQHSGHGTLIYRRENQFVGREIAVLVAV